jgi:ATP phosphoribosyltransferase regulatory subunit
MNINWTLPNNIEDSLPPESEILDSLSQSIKSIFRSYGFHFIIPPSIEFLDSLNTLEKDRHTNDNYFLTYDKNSNDTLAFRSDITVQAARIDSHILSYNKINKLYYEGKILTSNLDDEKLTRETSQIGAEIFGTESISCDRELQKILFEILLKIKLKNFFYTIGHVGFLTRYEPIIISNGISLSSFYESFKKRNKIMLQNVISKLEKKHQNFLHSLFEFNGKFSILNNIPKYLANDVFFLSEVRKIKKIFREFDHKNFYIDFCDLYGFNYHGGITFSVFGNNSKECFIRGGRYNFIGKQFGNERPATGFTINLNNIVNHLLKNNLTINNNSEIIYAPYTKDEALNKKIQNLRKSGKRIRYYYSISEIPKKIKEKSLLKKINSKWVLI